MAPEEKDPATNARSNIGPHTREEALDAAAWARAVWEDTDAAKRMLDAYSYEEGIRMMDHLAFVMRFALAVPDWDHLNPALNGYFDQHGTTSSDSDDN